MTFLDITILLHIAATGALYWQFIGMLKPTNAGAVLYGVAFAGWWMTLAVSAYRLGFVVGAP